MKSLNLGILAHVDAGKTSLTERLLYHTGMIKHLGSVDAGNTQTDSMALEQDRGITIQSAVVSIQLDNKTINLIDTPGHADFIAEVERALMVLDAVVLVISAVEGVQPQTRLLMKSLQQFAIPTILFVNKIDRQGACAQDLLAMIEQRLALQVVPMVSVSQAGEARATVQGHQQLQANLYHQLLEKLANIDDAFLARYIKEQLNLPLKDSLAVLKQHIAKQAIYPLYFGSAVTGAGISELINGIEDLLPWPDKDVSAPPSGTIFKIERNNRQEKICYVSLNSGQLAVKNTLVLQQHTAENIMAVKEKIAGIKVYRAGQLHPTQQIIAGQVAQLSGLKQAKIGDSFGEPEGTRQANQHVFSRPSLVTEIRASRACDTVKLAQSLQALSEQDPLIHAHHDPERQVLLVSLYGEVQKDVLKHRLLNEYQLDVEFTRSTMLCIERPRGVGRAVSIMDLHNAPLEFYATLGFRIEPGAIDSGIIYQLEVELGSLPKGYHSVVRESSLQFLQHGLSGWPVTDCIITLTHTGLCPLSQSPHFRQLTPILLQQALVEAGTMICQPYSHFRLAIPLTTLNAVSLQLANLHAHIHNATIDHDTYIIEGDIFTENIYELELNLPNLCHGNAVLNTQHAGFK